MAESVGVSDSIGGGKRKQSSPHLPIVEPTDQQWPTLTCPFLDKGEMAFIERFVRMEEGLSESKSQLGEVKEQVRYMRNALVGAIISIMVGIAVSIAAASYRSVHDTADARNNSNNTTAQVPVQQQQQQGAKK